MTKKEYMKPTMEVVEIDIHAQILAGSVDAYGMNKQLQGFDDPEDEVDWAW